MRSVLRWWLYVVAILVLAIGAAIACLLGEMHADVRDDLRCWRYRMRRRVRAVWHGRMVT